MSKNAYTEATELLYRGKTVRRGMDFGKPATFPYFPTTSFTMNSLTEVREAYRDGYTYVRTCNPNRDALADVVTFLEQGEKSLIFSAGMGAITSTMMTLLQSGDEILCNRNIYGETFSVMDGVLRKFGVNTIFVDFDDLALVQNAITPQTKMLYSEVLANPTLHIADIPALAKIAHDAGAWLMIDNTFTTPIAIKPIRLGADIVINSMTKFMNGLSDALGGSITSTAEIIDRIQPISTLTGTAGDPFASFTMYKNFGTMDLRLKRQMENAAKLAAALEKNKYVERVNHPSLESFPQHSLALKLFRSKESMAGIMSIIVPEDERKIDAFMERLDFVHYAATLGGIHATLMHSVTSSHKTMPDDKRRAMGITPGLIRISVGIEDVDDLIADFTQALEVFGE